MRIHVAEGVCFRIVVELSLPISVLIGGPFGSIFKRSVGSVGCVSFAVVLQVALEVEVLSTDIHQSNNYDLAQISEYVHDILNRV